MSRTSRVFRVFISSTFEDLKNERDALQEHVWPRLRALCELHGARFQPIDLRWGVSEEAGLDQQALPICLEEICRCQRVSPRPNFLVLLGDRYGWRPLPHEFSAEDFEAIVGALPGSSDVSSADRMVLERWYRRDDNATPSMYVLQPRTGAFVQGEFWATEERSLREAIRCGSVRSRLPKERYDAYFASATEHEILAGALGIGDTVGHVFAFLRRIPDLPSVPSAAAYRDVRPDGAPDDDARERLSALKARLRERLGRNVLEYSEEWAGNGPSGEGLAALCDEVFRRLSCVLQAELVDGAAEDELDAEIRAHRDFGLQRAKGFLGRMDACSAIDAHIAGDGTKPLLVVGAGGSGKSALMARTSLQAEERHSDAVVIARFLGATPSSIDARPLLAGLCMELARSYDRDQGVVPVEFRELAEEFGRRLGFASAGRPLILFLDALDQLSDANNAKRLKWLPSDLPEHVHLIVSSVPSDALNALEYRLPASNRLELASMPSSEGADLLDRWLLESRRAVTLSQRAHILDRFTACGLPLYLKLAFEEARRWRSDALPEQTRLAADVPTLIRQRLAHLSEEAAHGATLVSRALGYLAAGRNGLTEDELLDVLSRDADVMADFRRRSPRSPRVERLPFVAWSRLYHDLEPYLSERKADGTTTLAFFHRVFHEVVCAEYLASEGGQKRHCALAAYFTEKPIRIQSEGVGLPDIRKVSELVFHRLAGRQWDEVEGALTDFDFLMAKCEAGFVEALIWEYASALRALPKESVRRLQPWEAFFREKAHVLGRGSDDWPTNRILFQLAMEHADESPVTKAAEAFLADGRVDWAWLRNARRPKAVTRATCIRVFDGHGAAVTGACDLGNGRFASSSEDGSIAVWNEGTLEPEHQVQAHGSSAAIVYQPSSGLCISYSASERDLRVWDLTAGISVGTMRGHSGEIRGARLLGEGALVTWADDRTVRLWDVPSSRCTLELQGQKGVPCGVLEVPGGRLITWTDDGILHHWNLADGKLVRSLVGHAKPIRGVTRFGSGSLLSWDEENLFRWELETGLQSLAIESSCWLGGSGVVAVDEQSFLLGMRLFSAVTGEELVEPHPMAGATHTIARLGEGLFSFEVLTDPSFYVWTGKPGDAVLVCSGAHCIPVQSVRELTNQIVASWYGHDEKSIHLWNPRTGQHLGCLEGHTATPTDILHLGQGRVLSWAQDGTLRIWDLDAATDGSAYSAPSPEVERVVPSRDGFVATESWEGLSVTHRASGSVVAEFRDVRQAVPVSDGTFVGLKNGVIYRCDPRSGLRSPLPICHIEGGWIRGLSRLADDLLVTWTRTEIGVWDALSGSRVAHARRPDARIHDLQTTSTGLIIASGMLNFVDVWRVPACTLSRAPLERVAEPGGKDPERDLDKCDASVLTCESAYRALFLWDMSNLRGVLPMLGACQNRALETRSKAFASGLPSESAAVGLDSELAYLGRFGAPRTDLKSSDGDWDQRHPLPEWACGIQVVADAFSESVAGLSKDGHIYTWTASAPASCQTLSWEGCPAIAAAWLPGRRLVSLHQGENPDLRLWDVAGSRELKRYSLWNPNLHSLYSISSDMLLLCSPRHFVSGDRPVQFDLLGYDAVRDTLWKARSATGSLDDILHELKGHEISTIPGMVVRRGQCIAGPGLRALEVRTTDGILLSTWNGESGLAVHDVGEDGSIAVVSDAGKLSILHAYVGSGRISSRELGGEVDQIGDACRVEGGESSDVLLLREKLAADNRIRAAIRARLRARSIPGLFASADEERPWSQTHWYDGMSALIDEEVRRELFGGALSAKELFSRLADADETSVVQILGDCEVILDDLIDKVVINPVFEFAPLDSIAEGLGKFLPTERVAMVGALETARRRRWKSMPRAQVLPEVDQLLAISQEHGATDTEYLLLGAIAEPRWKEFTLQQKEENVARRLALCPADKPKTRVTLALALASLLLSMEETRKSREVLLGVEELVRRVATDEQRAEFEALLSRATSLFSRAKSWLRRRED
jgi:WD40 repeat protein